jgi:hypothetical protein
MYNLAPFYPGRDLGFWSQLASSGVAVLKEKSEGNGPFVKVWQWFRGQIIQPVPEETAVCEFDCRKLDCSMGEWESCDRRINHAAGELMPSPKSIDAPQK